MRAGIGAHAAEEGAAAGERGEGFVHQCNGGGWKGSIEGCVGRGCQVVAGKEGRIGSKAFGV